MSTFGTLFRVTTFGESHCKGVGCIIDNFPPGVPLTEEDIQPQLTRRRPGQSKLTTPRDEADLVTILSGTEHGRTLGTPIALFVANNNTRPKDYGEMSAIPRPGHADYTYQVKYGIRATSGGGRSSARETIGRVASGAAAEVFLRRAFGTQISCWVTSIGDIDVPAEAVHKPGPDPWTRDEIDSLSRLQLLRDPARWQKSPLEGREAEADQKERDAAYDAWLLSASGWLGDAAAAQDIPAYLHMPDLTADPGTCTVFSCDGKQLQGVDPATLRAWCCGDLVQVRCPHPASAARMATKIRHMKLEEDSTGGVLTCVIHNVPVGLGEPCFDKLEAKLAHAMLSLPATKGFEIGSGFAGTRLRGSSHNDVFVPPAQAKAGADPATDSDAPAPAKRRRGKVTVTGEVGAFDTALMRTKTNNAGGTLGGVSNGEDIVFRVAIKPVSTIGRAQATATYAGQAATLEARGRHDPCVLPRAGPLVEGMAAIVLMDAVLLQRARRAETLQTLPQAEARAAIAKRAGEE